MKLSCCWVGSEDWKHTKRVISVFKIVYLLSWRKKKDKYQEKQLPERAEITNSTRPQTLGNYTKITLWKHGEAGLTGAMVACRLNNRIYAERLGGRSVKPKSPPTPESAFWTTVLLCTWLSALGYQQLRFKVKLVTSCVQRRFSPIPYTRNVLDNWGISCNVSDKGNGWSHRMLVI